MYDVFQTLVSAVLVIGCSVYCVLALAPNGLKQVLRRWLLQWPLPSFVALKLAKPAPTSACGSGCQGCGPRPASAHTIQFHPRRR